MEKSTNFIFNLNQTVKVKLTELGINILRNRHLKLNQMIKESGGIGFDDFHVTIDEDGYTPFQLWNLIDIFKSQIAIGKEPVFDSNILFLDGQEVNEKKQLISKYPHILNDIKYMLEEDNLTSSLTIINVMLIFNYNVYNE